MNRENTPSLVGLTDVERSEYKHVRNGSTYNTEFNDLWSSKAFRRLKKGELRNNVPNEITSTSLNSYQAL